MLFLHPFFSSVPSNVVWLDKLQRSQVDHLHLKGTGREMQIPPLTTYTKPSHLGLFSGNFLFFFQFPNIHFSLNKQITVIDNNTYHLLTFACPTFSKTRKRKRDLNSGTETLIHIHTHPPKIKEIAKDQLWCNSRAVRGLCSPDLREYWGIFFHLGSIAKDLLVLQIYPRGL